MTKQFGGKLNQEHLTRYQNSPNWKDGKFQNLELTTMNIRLTEVPKLLYKQLIDRKGRVPQQVLPIAKFDLEKFLQPNKEPQFIWYGHSAVLMRWKNKTILFDPMLGDDSAPIAPFKAKRFSDNTLDLIKDFPEIDLLLMSHDHYDHLDYASIQLLKSKTKKYFVALGVARHLEAWGVDKNLIQEFDWWDKAAFEGIQFTFTPSRHFSGRGIKDRAKSLWGGWAMLEEQSKVYWSGDGGYGNHFKEIGETFGGFDFGFMECGQYDEKWHAIHMYPEECVQAALDVNVKRALPVHWGGFALALHHWKDPIERFIAEAEIQKLQTLCPEIGTLNTYNSKSSEWWKNYS